MLLELNGGEACKSYLIACPEKRRAVILDPLKPNIARYLGVLAYHGLTLDYVIDSHSHADHFTASFELTRLTGSRVVMHETAPAPKVQVHVRDGDNLKVGKIPIQIFHTPGHTPDSIALHLPNQRVLYTGDTILIGVTGRTDFAGGDPGQSYDSIQRLLSLPDDTTIFPGHDYRGNTTSTVGIEKMKNPRIAGKTREEYIGIMNNLGLPLPQKIMEALQCNTGAVNDNEMKFPTITELNAIRQLEPNAVRDMIANNNYNKTNNNNNNKGTNSSLSPVIVDVRQKDEYESEHIPGSILIPLNELPKRYTELEEYKGRKIICVCRAGVRSTTAAALLTGLGFADVNNLKGGMLAWTATQSKKEK